jgi:uncharacterized small protein (DUF1192 family)
MTKEEIYERIEWLQDEMERLNNEKYDIDDEIMELYDTLKDME